MFTCLLKIFCNRWLPLVSALLVMAHTHGGFGLYQSLSLPPFRRCLPLPHFRGSLPLPPLSSFLSTSHSTADTSLFQPSGLFSGICIFCSRSICTTLGEGSWPSRAN
ncbi:hypothetical protein Taro_027447 [Colocasia esculenta]|uniref:Secreted protein n=1 Tax=Colocasia esculenta TaxID=4460 RepID=A0A843VFS0_COLES|nr:hypothetical protein [Colocasia esculenta]